MAITYEAWLKATGKPPTAANAMTWKTTHGVALGMYNPDGSPKSAAPASGAPAAAAPEQVYKPPPPPPPPNWQDVYNTGDATSAGEIAGLKRKYGDVRDQATKAYQQWVTQNYGGEAIGADGNFDPTKATGGQVARINRDVGLGVDRQQNNAAARGMFRSGSRIVNEGQERTAGAERLVDLGHERDRQEFGMTSARTNADTDEAVQANSARTAAAQRAMDDYNRKYGAGSF